jgi:hypothetical protein
MRRAELSEGRQYIGSGGGDMACVPDACLVGRLRVWGWNRGEGRLASYLPETGDEASRVGWGRGTRVLPLPVARRRRSLGRDGIYQSWNGDGEWYLGPALFRVTIGPELVEQIKLIVPASMRFMRVASFTVFNYNGILLWTGVWWTGSSGQCSACLERQRERVAGVKEKHHKITVTGGRFGNLGV